MTDRASRPGTGAADLSVFEQTVRQAVGIDEPPPASTGVTATSLGALGDTGT